MRNSADTAFHTRLDSAPPARGRGFEGTLPREGFQFEDEVKTLNVDREKLVQQLEARGGEVTFDGFIVDEYFDIRNGSLPELLGDWPRIRQKYSHGKIEFQLSIKDGRIQTASGGTVTLESKDLTFESYDDAYKALGDMLEGVGISSADLYAHSSFGKFRTSVQCGNVQVDIDSLRFTKKDGEYEEDLRYIPTYAEFEVLHKIDSSEDEQNARIAERDALMRELGLEPGPAEAQGKIGNLIDFYRARQ